MKISFNNLGIYSVKNYPQKQSFGCNNCKKTMGVKEQLPNPALYADLNDFSVDWERQDALGNEYCNKILSVCFDENGKLDERLKNYLDNTPFEIETASGRKEMMTVKEAIQSSIIKSLGDVDKTLYHSTWSTTTGDQIIKNGFDVDKIARTQFGPGFYFSPSYGSAREYNSAVLKADCKGKCALVEGPYFDRITNTGVTTEIANFIEIPQSEYGTAKYGLNAARKVLFEYTRDLIVNELGYDMAYGASRFDACYVVYNPKAISNIRYE